jgi:hypothetical protein
VSNVGFFYRITPRFGVTGGPVTAFFLLICWLLWVAVVASVEVIYWLTVLTALAVRAGYRALRDA